MTNRNQKLDMYLQRIEEKLDKLIESMNNSNIVQAEIRKDIAHLQKENINVESELHTLKHEAEENKRDIIKMKSTVNFQKRIGWTSFTAAIAIILERIWKFIVGG